MFEEIRQKLGAVLQQGFLETNSRYFLSLAIRRCWRLVGSFGWGMCNWIIGIVGNILGEQLMHSQR